MGSLIQSALSGLRRPGRSLKPKGFIGRWTHLSVKIFDPHMLEATREVDSPTEYSGPPKGLEGQVTTVTTLTEYTQEDLKCIRVILDFVTDFRPSRKTRSSV